LGPTPIPTSSAPAGMALQIPITAAMATAYLIIACSYECETLEPIPCCDECSGKAREHFGCDRIRVNRIGE